MKMRTWITSTIFHPFTLRTKILTFLILSIHSDSHKSDIWCHGWWKIGKWNVNTQTIATNREMFVLFNSFLHPLEKNKLKKIMLTFNYGLRMINDIFYSFTFWGHTLKAFNFNNFNKFNTEVLWLKTTLNTLVFPNRLLNSILTLRGGTAVWWYSMKIHLPFF